MTTEEKRDELRERIEAAEARNAERTLGDRAKEAADTATEFVKEHPLATVAGVAVLGIAIGAMTKPGRRVGRRAGAMAAYASELGLAYASGLLDSAGDLARTGGDKLEDLGDSIGDSARDARRRAAFQASAANDGARRLTRELGKKAGRTMRDLRGRKAG